MNQSSNPTSLVDLLNRIDYVGAIKDQIDLEPNLPSVSEQACAVLSTGYCGMHVVTWVEVPEENTLVVSVASCGIPEEYASQYDPGDVMRSILQGMADQHGDRFIPEYAVLTVKLPKAQREHDTGTASALLGYDYLWDGPVVTIRQTADGGYEIATVEDVLTTEIDHAAQRATAVVYWNALDFEAGRIGPDMSVSSESEGGL